MPTARTLAPAALLAALVLTACNQGRKADRDDEPNDPVAKAFAALKQPRKADPVRADAADPARPAAPPRRDALPKADADDTPPTRPARAADPDRDEDEDDEPADRPGKRRARPGKPAAPKGKGAEWGGGDSIPLDRASQGDSVVTFGPADCPVAVVGREVWDLKGMKPLTTLDGDGGLRNAASGLSPDGKYFAAVSHLDAEAGTTVTVWDTGTGAKVKDFEGGKKSIADLVAFRDNTTLLVGGRHLRHVAAWDLAAEKAGPRLAVPDNHFQADRFALTRDGKYYAYVGGDAVVVADAATGKKAVAMAPPGPGVPPPGDPLPLRSVPGFVYTWAQGLAFSPDGTELALVSTHPSHRIVVWNTKGKLLIDAPLPVQSRSGPDKLLQWLPNGTGWLVGGYMIDRETGRVLLVAKTPFAADVKPRLVDDRRLAGMFGDDSTRVRFVTVPWQKLRRAAQAMAANEPAHIAPGVPVSVDVRLAGTRGGVDETYRLVAGALVKRLARDGVPVADGQGTVVRLRFTEAAGEALAIYERQTRFDFRGRDTGRTATDAKGDAVVELFVPGSDEPVWRAAVKAFSAGSYDGAITDATVRASMLSNLASQLGDLDLPYFIPKAADLAALPAVVE